MIHRSLVSLGVLALVMGMVSLMPVSCSETYTTPASGSSATAWSPSKTPWGDPDLQGKWTNDPTTTPMERPAAVGSRLFLEEAELAEKAKRELTLAEGATEEELAGPVRPRDVDRNRFSAASCDRERKPRDTNSRASTSNRAAVRRTIDEDECFGMLKHATPRGAGSLAILSD
jgi:hypothetical protein